MAQHWQEILPIDRYVVAASGLLHEYDRKVLTFLYQPLIGPVCISLYMSLWAELEDYRISSEPNSHHGLMNIMSINLKEIYEARLKLEGIGLVKTFVHHDQDIRSFIYELQPPLTPEQFFLDGMLNIYLYRKIGKNQYVRLKRFFSHKLICTETKYEQITKEFQDVFESANPANVYLDMQREIPNLGKESYIGRTNPKAIQINHSGFNFELLFAGLNDVLVPKSAINDRVKNAISNLSFLYGIDPIEMKNIVISAINEQNEIEIEELRKAARDWYQMENEDQLPALIDKTQAVIHQTQTSPPQTKEEELIYYLDTTSPRQLLMDLAGGSEPTKADLQIIEEVMFKQKLNPGVVNVLIQYVLLKTDMKLTKAYIEKIAGHWARKKIKTVKEAMELAKNEHKQYLEWAEGKKSSKHTKKRPPIRTEKIPEWFNEEETTTVSIEENAEFEQKRRALEEKLKKYKK